VFQFGSECHILSIVIEGNFGWAVTWVTQRVDGDLQNASAAFWPGILPVNISPLRLITFQNRVICDIQVCTLPTVALVMHKSLHDFVGTD
jgi:hypothetical protein